MSGNHNDNQRPVKTYAGGKPNYVTDPEPTSAECAMGYAEGFNACAPKKEWVGLTKQDTWEIAEKCGLADEAWLDLMNAIEAKLKEKNT